MMQQTSCASPANAVPIGTALVLSPGEAHMLTEVGFLAAARGDISRAEKIFNALRIWRPNRAFPLIGMAVAYMNAGRYSDAARVLDTNSMPSEEGMQLLVWRGLAVWLGGHRHAGSLMLREAIKSLSHAGPDTDPQILELARALVDTTTTNQDLSIHQTGQGTVQPIDRTF